MDKKSKSLTRRKTLVAYSSYSAESAGIFHFYLCTHCIFTSAEFL